MTTPAIASSEPLRKQGRRRSLVAVLVVLAAAILVAIAEPSCPPSVPGPWSVCGQLGASCCGVRPACVAGASCAANLCVDPQPDVTLGDLEVQFHTAADDKQADSGVNAAIEGHARWSQGSATAYAPGSTHAWPLDPPSIRLVDLAARRLSVCLQPAGNDAWTFDLDLLGNRSDGLPFAFHQEGISLSAGNPCASWDAAPPAAPSGRIGVFGRCVSPLGGRTAPGTRIVIDDCRGDRSQHWTFAPGGEIRHSSGLCLDVPGADPRDSNVLQLWDCNQTHAQTWRATDADEIRGLADKCVDIAGASTARGTPVQLYTCNGTQAQLFALPRCGGPGQICCASSAPCRDATHACKAGLCAASPAPGDQTQPGR